MCVHLMCGSWGWVGTLELRPATSLQDLFVPWLAPLLTPLPASPGATDLHLCRDASVELCYSYLEARQAPCNSPLTSLSPALTELPTAVLTLAFRQTQFMLKEWGSEFSPRKLGALEQPQEESSRQLSVVGAGATVPCLDGLRISEEDKEPDSEEEWYAGLSWRNGGSAGLGVLRQAASGSSIWGPWHLLVE